MDIQPSLVNMVGYYYTLIMSWMWDNPGWMSFIFLFLALALLAWGYRTAEKRKLRRYYNMRTERMNPTQREQLLKRIMADGIHDAFFEAWHRGEITEEEYQRKCQQAANIFDLGDLVPRQRKLLKKQLKERTRSIRREAKPKIPGEPPPAKVEVNNFDDAKIIKSDSFLGQFLSWRKAS